VLAATYLFSFNLSCSFFLLLIALAVLLKMASTDSSDIESIQSCQNDPPSKVELTIHHQFPGTELVSPVYASKGATCYLSPDQSVDIGSTAQVGFNINLSQSESIGALMYKLQRKNTNEFDGDEAACIQFVIIWKVDDSKEFCVASFLIEHDKGCAWDRDGLMKLAEHYSAFNIQHGPVEETWLMHDNTVLMTSLSVTHEEECCELEMTISETSIKDDTQRLLYIDMDR
jgi:hypothetical protein